MPIYRVQAPDGSILRIEGPDLADPGELEAIAKQHYEATTTPSQPAAAEPTIGQQALGAGEALATGITGATTGTLGGIGAFLKASAEEMLAGKFGTPEAANRIEQVSMQGLQDLTFAPRTESGQQIIEKAGEVGAQLLPATGLVGELGMIGKSAAQAAPVVRAAVQPALSAAQEAVTTAPGRSAQAVRSAVTGAEREAPAVAPAAEAAAEVTPQEMGSLLKTASGNGLGSAKAQERLAEVAKINPEAKAAADRLGIDLPADVFSDSPQLRAAAGLSRSQVASEAEAAWKSTVNNAIDRADEVIQQFDANFVEGAPSVGGISQKVLDSLNATRSGLNAEAKKIYDAVDQAVPKESPATLSNVKRTLDEITQEVGKDGMTSQEKRLANMAAEGAPTYGRLLREKNLIGQAIAGKDSPYGNMDAAALKRLYGAIAEDQLATVEAVGGEPLRQQLRGANLLYAKERALGKRIISGFGKEGDGSIGNLIRNSITSASKGDATAFRKLLKTVPEDLRKETLATALASTARSTRAGQQGFGFAEFAKTYQGLRSNPPVYAEITKTLGEGSDAVLRDLYEISKRITEARANVLQTGKANQALLESLQAEGLLGKIANSAMGKRAIASGAAVLGGPVGAAVVPDILGALSKSGPDSVKAVGQLFHSPEFQKLAIEAATKETIPAAAVRKVVLSLPFRRYAKLVRLPDNIKQRELWLLGALQAPQQLNENAMKGARP